MSWSKPMLLAGLGAVLLLLGVAACTPLATLNALASSDAHTLVGDVAYGPLPRQRLDIYRPAGAAPPGGWPEVVFFYGGSWKSGERVQYGFVGAALASRCMLAMVADYRLYPEVRFPEFLRDSVLALALAWGIDRANDNGGNPHRVFVMGHSTGAYNAAMLALDPRWLASSVWPDRDPQPVFFHPDYPPGTQPMAFAGAQGPRSFLAACATDDLVDPERKNHDAGSAAEGGVRSGHPAPLCTCQSPDADRYVRCATALAGTGAGRRGRLRGERTAGGAALI